MMVYIASEVPLESIAWVDSAPAFHVVELTESEASVRKQFRAAHAYYVGAHEGCGCGFQYGEYPEQEDRPLMRASLDALADYLVRQLERVKEIELHASWDGDQGATPAHRRRLTPRSLRDEEFYFLHKELSRIAAE